MVPQFFLGTRRYKVVGGEVAHVDRWATLLPLLLLLQLSPDLWPLNLYEWLSSWQHRHLTCSLPQWRGPLSLCCSENDSDFWQKQKAGPHICLCVTPHSLPSRVYSSSSSCLCSTGFCSSALNVKKASVPNMQKPVTQTWSVPSAHTHTSVHTHTQTQTNKHWIPA